MKKTFYGLEPDDEVYVIYDYVFNTTKVQSVKEQKEFCEFVKMERVTGLYVYLRCEKFSFYVPRKYFSITSHIKYDNLDIFLEKDKALSFLSNKIESELKQKENKLSALKKEIESLKLKQQEYNIYFKKQKTHNNNEEL